MPLVEGAKEGSSGFKKNIETEMKAGKPQKQAVAIAYREARGDMSAPEFKKLTDLLDEFFKEEAEEPEHKNDSALSLDVHDADGQLRGMLEHVKKTAAVGHSFKVVVDPDDSEHRKEFHIDGDGAVRINDIDARTDGAVLMDALSSLRGRVEVAASRK